MAVNFTAQIEPGNKTVCKISLDDPIYEDGIAMFDNAQAAEGSDLPARLFAVEGVKKVQIAGNDIKVTREEWKDWRPVIVELVDAIAAHQGSDSAAISSSFEPMKVPDTETLKKQVQDIFDNMINPAVASHGGVIELLDVRNTDVYLRMGGGCQGCGMANVTLKQGIETTLREELPYLGSILDVTDHAGGSNPYYAPSSK